MAMPQKEEKPHEMFSTLRILKTERPQECHIVQVGGSIPIPPSLELRQVGSITVPRVENLRLSIEKWLNLTVWLSTY